MGKVDGVVVVVEEKRKENSRWRHFLPLKDDFTKFQANFRVVDRRWNRSCHGRSMSAPWFSPMMQTTARERLKQKQRRRNSKT